MLDFKKLECVCVLIVLAGVLAYVLLSVCITVNYWVWFLDRAHMNTVRLQGILPSDRTSGYKGYMTSFCGLGSEQDVHGG